MKKKDSKFYKSKNYNNMRKYIIVILSIFILCAELSAHSGILAGEKNLRIAKTKWFDIIYPARCEASAAILYEKADTVYDEVTAQYGLTPSFRIPVVITPAVEQFNAFWAGVPYNHIAIYDTGASGSGELAVFSETLLSTFRHELTHAVTYNMKNKFWHGVSNFFGDFFAPGMLSVTTGMAEGATVTSESAAGEGRLNDEYAMHYVKQAIIEDDFPSYHDVSGASDVMPGGAPYYFNGAFHQWLQEKYGMAAYSEFWWRVVNGINFTISGAFKKSFGIKLKKAWNSFAEDYQTADVAANPISDGLVCDFFEPDEDDYSSMNNAGSMYKSLAVSSKYLVWLDLFGGRVYAAKAKKTANLQTAATDQAYENPLTYNHIFDLRGITSIGLSNNGRFLAASYISENGIGVKARVKIYDFDRGTFFSVKESGLIDATIVEKDGDFYLLAQKYLAQHYSIVIYKLLLSDGNQKITDLQAYAEVKFDVETNPFEFTPLADGTFSYLKKKGLSYSLCISDINGSLLQEYAFPKGTVVRSLSYSPSVNDKGCFYFSYAEKNTLPRLGKLNLEKEIFEFSDFDISGGVFEPVFWDGKVVYIGEFYRQNRLLFIEDNAADIVADAKLPDEKYIAGGAEYEPGDSGETRGAGYETKDYPPAEYEPTNYPSTNSAFSIKSSPYNPFPYLARGIFIPASIYKSDYFGCNTGYTSNYNIFYLGATYITSNPWSKGNSDLMLLTGGWNAFSNSFGLSLTINKGTSTPLLQSQTEIKSEFDSKGWKQGGGILTLSSGFRIGNVSTASISNKAYALFGRQNKKLHLEEDDAAFYSSISFLGFDKIGITAPENDDFYGGFSDIITASFSTIRKAGPGRYEKKGISFALTYGLWYDLNLSEPEKDSIFNNSLAGAIKLCLPYIIPVKSKYGFTYNLPATLNFSLLPSSTIYGYTFSANEKLENMAGRAIFDAQAEVILFSMDIQKAIPGVTAVFLNNFYISGGYAGTASAGSASTDGFQTSMLADYFKALADGRGHYMDSIYLKSGIELTPNIGIFASPAIKFDFFTIFSYTLHSVKSIRPQERFRFTFGLDLKF